MTAAIFMQPAKAPAARSLTAFLSGDGPVAAIRRLVSRPTQWKGAIGLYRNNRVQSRLSSGENGSLDSNGHDINLLVLEALELGA